MPRLFRPYIPIPVRCRVAMRQLGELWPDAALLANVGDLDAFLIRLKKKLCELLGEDRLHLDHDPPLAARQRTGEGRQTVYDPPANDPDYLIYRGVHAHRIKTNVRGEHGQHPDRVLIKRVRRSSSPSRRSKKSTLRGLSFQQARCAVGARCSCDRKKRKRCRHYRRK